MKTFAYLALIGTALAVRLTETATVVDEQAQLEALANVTDVDLTEVKLDDLGPDAKECLKKGAKDELEA